MDGIYHNLIRYWAEA
ncbi:hypothetical protein JQ634_21785 [Bradyrhizobium sp. AUGA SZCCT0240]|nr:hypothetical protein [Bradyrhizobium sp. AUGA SZCCT0160]MBR1195824.1 hypothetical protein [Bradyrhizobium sp. AUGA SZCCT0158]MBR1240223.1 hypothetical protein [Bradyrhizobium sp. AUGA SZCCT0274]MBR1250954.1 hypothetical protein [Bradyrhizobium sp. AUGA SZCCT0169]MBR1256323.1 hypothetical protein [Bradyrhizobium sp. AUGA SZCCT0240]MBR1271829.1 hypothetical protein [Bradyrhizobium sp. AUGA SZCCT0222]